MPTYMAKQEICQYGSVIYEDPPPRPTIVELARQNGDNEMTSRE